MIEAIRKAISARSDVRQWPFAVLHLVQAVELIMKELLRRQHPIFIYENIDSPRNTVTLAQAMSRLENSAIAGITIPVRNGVGPRQVSDNYLNNANLPS